MFAKNKLVVDKSNVEHKDNFSKVEKTFWKLFLEVIIILCIVFFIILSISHRVTTYNQPKYSPYSTSWFCKGDHGYWYKYVWGYQLVDRSWHMVLFREVETTMNQRDYECFCIDHQCGGGW